MTGHALYHALSHEYLQSDLVYAASTAMFAYTCCELVHTVKVIVERH